jgi:ureidoglycolate hydrolase
MPRFTASDSNSFEPLSEGDYTFVIVKATDEIGQTSGNSYIHLQLQEVESKKNVFENVVFTPKTKRRVTNFWRALGHSCKDGDDVEFETADLVGEEIRAHVSVTEYNGDLQNDVEYFIEPDVTQTRKQPAAPVPTKKPIEPF